MPEKKFREGVREGIKASMEKEMLPEGFDDELVKRMMRVNKDSDWIRANQEKLRAEHKGEWIAVIDGEVLYSDKKLKNVIMRIKDDGKLVGAFAIDYVSAQKRKLNLDKVELHSQIKPILRA